MAVEPRRGCGWRKVGGLYLVAGKLGEPCHRLPFPLDVCPVCSCGIKQTRGWTWIKPVLLGASCESDPDRLREWGGSVDLSKHCARCAICTPSKLGERAGLLWIGAQFYKTPGDFERETTELGLSRRISAIPRGFKMGETWVLLAHPAAIPAEPLAAQLPGHSVTAVAVEEPQPKPGIFRAFKPERIEKLIRQSDATPDVLNELAEKGITPVIVPDDDKDHQGTVYDKQDEALPLGAE